MNCPVKVGGISHAHGHRDFKSEAKWPVPKGQEWNECGGLPEEEVKLVLVPFSLLSWSLIHYQYLWVILFSLQSDWLPAMKGEEKWMYKILISFNKGEIKLSIVRCFYSKNKVLNINALISFNGYSHQIRLKILPKCSYFPLLYSQNINASRLIFAPKLHLSLNCKDFSTLQNTVIGNTDTVYGKQQLWLIWITSSHLLKQYTSQAKRCPTRNQVTQQQCGFYNDLWPYSVLFY